MAWAKGNQLGKNNKGKPHSLEHRRKLSKAKIGSKNPSWKGGITPMANKRIHNLEFQLIRHQCFERDDYRCQVCGTDKRIETHHIVPWKISHDDSLENLITLCISCHRTIDNRLRGKK